MTSQRLFTWIMVLFLSASTPALAWGFSLRGMWRNNRGAHLLKEQRPFEASQSLIDGLAMQPLQAETHLNLGLAFEQQKELDKAYREYAFAAKNARTPELRFQALFNVAHVLGDMQKIPEAISMYQQALDINPNSREAKTNIELLLEQKKGGGQGDKQQQQQNNQGQNKQQKPNDPQNKQNQQPQSPQPQNRPQQFKSQDLSQEDVRRILEELKQQEQKVRAKDHERGHKEAPGGKNW